MATVWFVDKQASWRRRHPVLVAFGGVLLLNGMSYLAVITWLRLGVAAGAIGGVATFVSFAAYMKWSLPAFFDDDGTPRSVR